jgi:hypothetical protein
MDEDPSDANASGPSEPLSPSPAEPAAVPPGPEPAAPWGAVPTASPSPGEQATAIPSPSFGDQAGSTAPVPPEGPAAVAWGAPPPSKNRRNPIVLAVLVVALLVIGAVGALIFIGATLSPYDQATIRVGQRLEADPAFKAKYGDLDGDKAVQAGIALVRDGVTRVDDATQLTLFQTTSKALDLAADDACAALAKGTEDPDLIVPVLKKLDTATLDAYFDATATAALASVHGDPVRDSPTDEEQASAGTAWSAAAGEDAFNKDLSVLQDPATHTDAEVCAADRELTHAALTLGAQDRTTIIRAVYKGTGG